MAATVEVGNDAQQERILSSHEPSNSNTGCDKRTQNRHDVLDLQTGVGWHSYEGWWPVGGRPFRFWSVRWLPSRH